MTKQTDELCVLAFKLGAKMRFANDLSIIPHVMGFIESGLNMPEYLCTEGNIDTIAQELFELMKVKNLGLKEAHDRIMSVAKERKV